ncbi:MAG: TolC family protein, partial [Muribaculaceae bacterium]|nr:TolC family protein [Muribaculaceae bacterium]
MKKSIITLILLVCMTLTAQADALMLTRDECRKMALANSEDIHIADNAVRQAELDRKVADVGRLPKLDGSLTGMMMLPDIDMMGSKLQTRGAYMAGLQIV